MDRKVIWILFAFAILFVSVGAVNAADTNQSDTLQMGESTQAELSEDLSISGESDSSSNSSDGQNQAYLILDNDADKENIHIGDYVTFIIEVLNLGPDVSLNTQVHDEIPDGLEYVSHTLTKGSFDSSTGIWDIGDLSVDDGQVTLYITLKALTTGEKINKANLTTDSINLNNESYEEEEIDVEEDDSDDDSSESHAESDFTVLKVCGNPLFLVLMCLFAVLIPSIRKP